MTDNANTANLLLRYAINTDPFPLEASPSSGNLSMAQLTAVATNASGAAVQLQGMSITLPIGEDADQLTSDVTDIGPQAPDNWTLHDTKEGEGTVEYVFYPNPPYGEVADGESLTFIFNTIKLNRETGTAEVTVKEGSAGNPTQSLYVTKFPAGWGEVSFWVDPPDIPKGASTTLHWSGPEGATYTIEYYDWSKGTEVKVPAAGKPPLSNDGQYPAQDDPPLTLQHTTVFTLNVDETILGQTYHAQEQKQVTVAPPKPTITLFKGEIEQGSSGIQLKLTWAIEDANSAEITGVSFAVNHTGGSLLITPTPQEPLASSYTLTAENDSGQATSQLNLNWGRKATTLSGKGPQGVAVAPDNSRVFVANQGDFTLSVFDAKTLQFVKQLSEQTSGLSGGIAISPDSARVFVGLSKQIAAFDVQTLQPISGSGVNVGNYPANVAVAPDNSRVFVSNQNDNTVSVLDASTLHLIGSAIKVGTTPVGIVVSPDSTRVFVAGFNSNTVTVLDAKTLQPVGQPIPVGQQPSGIAVAPNGSRVFVSNGSDSTLSVIDAKTLQVFKTVEQMGDWPSGVAVSPDGAYILVSSWSVVTVLDANTLGRVGWPIQLSNGRTSQIAVSPDNTRVFVTYAENNTISVIVPVISGGTGA